MYRNVVIETSPHRNGSDRNGQTEKYPWPNRPDRKVAYPFKTATFAECPQTTRV